MAFDLEAAGATGIGSDPVMLFLIVAGILAIGFMVYAILTVYGR